MIAPVQLFSPGTESITDFSKQGSGSIFNSSLVPAFNALEGLVAPENQAFLQEQNQQLQSELTEDLYRKQSDDAFLDQLQQSAPQQQQPQFQREPEVDYNSEPTPQVASQGRLEPKSQPWMNDAPPETSDVEIVLPSGAVDRPTAQGKESLKLSNYGYDSDSSPDYNSNTLRIGHSDNPLKDGVSAALTRSLAKKYGLKTGDMFQITTADGKTMTRRYDDTVPTTYKGKPLPPTVDLYELKGSNKFGGKVTSIAKL